MNAGYGNLTVTAATTYGPTLVRTSTCDPNGCCDGSTPTCEGIYVINPFSPNNDTVKTY